jgi:hypothetical protein
MATGCVYDPDAKCGDDLILSDDGFTCECPKGAIFTPQGCIRCSKNEVAVGAACNCKPGFSRPGAGLACEKTEPMETPDPPAGDGGATTETEPPAKSCSGPADCDAPDACNVNIGECVSYPTGLKNACTQASDCAGFEAAYCNVGFSNVCEVDNCDVVNNDCFPGFHCCDVTPLMLPGTLCIEEMYPCP